MLACGVECQPSEIRRVTTLLESSTRPAQVMTDVGLGYLKGAESPAGPDALISELVSAELGRQMGLAIPPFAVVHNLEIEIPMRSHNGVIRPPAFYSHHVDGTTSDGTDLVIKRITNKPDIAKLVVFDTWIRNCDRCIEAHDGQPQLNRDNLLFEVTEEGTWRLCPIDHSHCFVDTLFSEQLGSEQIIDDENIYGFFPEFKPYIDAAAVAGAIAAMLLINRERIVEIVNSVPAQWGLGNQERHLLVELIERRAERVAGFAPFKLVEAPQMNLSGSAQ